MTAVGWAYAVGTLEAATVLTGQWTCTKNLEPQLAMHSLGLKVGKPKPAQQEMMFQDRMIQVGTGIIVPALARP